MVGDTFHISNSSNTTQIKYYISDSSFSGDISWNSIVDPTRREYVKDTFVNSLLKWNNVYFYKQIGSNLFIKNKIVNIVEGTMSDNNIIIYPESDSAMGEKYASTSHLSDGISLVGFQNGLAHYHCDKWSINLRLSDHITYSLESDHILNMAGAHELGHVLGLRDIDRLEHNNQQQGWHHEEVLMGYSSGSVLTRQTEITYKDLIGAAITRGFHTDADHTWILHSYSNSEYKLICSICNGVIYVDSLSNLNYVDYKDCGDNHALSSNNMMAVASYGDKDYYKCKYCRYVAPFTSLVNQSNIASGHYDSDYHLVTNQVNGLFYSFLEPHTFNENGICVVCNSLLPHSFTDHYETYSLDQHKAYCSCGEYLLKPHAADYSRSYLFHGHLYAPCINCGAIIDLGGGGPIIPEPGSISQMVSDNGSYILSNGIYVIMEEDLLAYLNGTLVFHPINEITN